MNKVVTILRMDNRLSYQHLYSTVFQVATPYICFQEADEQILESGIEECVTFLENNPEYGACTGLTGGFDFYSDKDASSLRLFDWYSMFSAPLACDQQSVIERLQNVCEPFAEFALFGGVIRTAVLLKITEELKNIRFANNDLYKKYAFIRALSLGKIEYFSTCYTKFKNRNTLSKKTLSWEKQVICNQWMDDFALLVDRVSDYLFVEQGIPEEVTDKLLRDVFFASKQRVYATDYFQYIPLKKRFRNLNYIFSLLERVVPQKRLLAVQKGLLFLKVYKMAPKPKQQWQDIVSLVHFLHKKPHHEAQ
jgi:hypothetical protein